MSIQLTSANEIEVLKSKKMYILKGRAAYKAIIFENTFGHHSLEKN